MRISDWSSDVCSSDLGVLNVVVGRGESVGNALINHPRVNMISLTGDIATGRKVLAAAAKSVKRTHLELGGTGPVLVFDDAAIAAGVQGLRPFGYSNAGQARTPACRPHASSNAYGNPAPHPPPSVSH